MYYRVKQGPAAPLAQTYLISDAESGLRYLDIDERLGFVGSMLHNK